MIQSNNMNLVITTDDLKNLNKATFDAFIASGSYLLSKNQAYAQFGRGQIDALIANKLLKNTSEFPSRCKFLISDIVSAIHIWNKMDGDTLKPSSPKFKGRTFPKNNRL